MARLLTQKDIYSIINAMVEDITGQTSEIRAVDTSTFISAGELILSYGTENVLNSLGLLVGRILVASREYRGGFDLINAIDTGVFTHRLEKISFYAKKATASGAWNTDLYTNLYPGYTNGVNNNGVSDQSTKSMWEQFPGIPLVMNFAGSSVWDECITIYEVQLQQAFRGENEFNEFVSGMLVEHENDIESEKEAFRRAVVLNHIAGVYDLSSVMPGSVINLTEEFNKTYYGSDTSAYKTSAELRSTYLKEFLEFMVSEIKIVSMRLKNRSANYHWTPAKTIGGVTYPLLRHTPANRQKLFLYEPLFIKSEAMVYPEIFQPRYLDMDTQYEGIEFWQNENDPSAIQVEPAIPETDSTSANYGTQKKGSKVSLDYVVGCLFDEDAMMVDFQLDRTDSTPLEARKLYRNLWLHISKNGINDFTEKAVIFTMEDPSNSNNTKRTKK